MIGVDPAVGGGDETGIIIAGKDENGLIWVLDDLSLKAEPHRWALAIEVAAAFMDAGVALNTPVKWGGCGQILKIFPISN